MITRFIETDTGEVYQHEREYTCDLIRPEEILDTLSVGAPIDKYKYMAPMRPEWREFVGDPNDPSIFIKEPGYSGKEVGSTAVYC